MGHTDTKHRKLDLGHQVRCFSELTSQSIEGSDALRSPAHNQCINTHSLELLQRIRRRHQARVYSLPRTATRVTSANFSTRLDWATRSFSGSHPYVSLLSSCIFIPANRP